MPDLGPRPINYLNHYVDTVKRDTQTAINAPNDESCYVKNADISGCKNGVDLRYRLPGAFVDGAKVRNCKPEPGSSTTAFGNGVALSNAGTTYLRDLDIDLELGLKADQNTDCVSDDGQGNDGDNSFMGEWLYITRAHLRNPGETAFDCKRLNFVMHDSTLEGTAEELVKHWRASDGYYISVTFDLRKVQNGVSFRLRGANGNKAKLHFYGCSFIMPNGEIVTGLPPVSTVSFESGQGGVYENSFFLLSEIPQFIVDNSFFELNEAGPVEPPADAVTREEFDELSLRVSLIETQIRSAGEILALDPNE